MDESLISKVEKYLKTPFRLGKTDCLTVALDFLDDPCKDDIKGRYKTLMGARRTLSKLTGYESIQDYMETHHESVHALCLQDGDVLVDGDHCLVYFGGRVLHVRGERFAVSNFDILNNILPAYRKRNV